MVRLCLFLIPIVPAVDTFLVSLGSCLCMGMALRSLQLPINLSPAYLTSSSSIFPPGSTFQFSPDRSVRK